MPSRIRIKSKKRVVCIGDLKDRITLQDRNIQPPVFGSVDFDENFKTFGIAWALIKTVSGKTHFDGVSKETNITHEIHIVFDETVTDQTWIILEKGRRLDILEFENLDERSQFLKLICTDRGASSKPATAA